MDTMWISEVLFLYFQCLYISSLQVAELVKMIRYPGENTLNISCWNTSQIQIQKINVQVEETTCGQCVLNSNDTQTIEDNCNGENSCLVDYNFTSACLREFRYVNLSYTCKHENGTNISTFEDDFGDWNSTYSNLFTWHRTNLVSDHTMIAGVGSKGHSLSAPSYSGKAGTERIDTNNAFMEPICLTFWYQFYRNAYDCIFSIYRITDENQTLIFTVDDNSTQFNTWINKSVDVYGQYPFKITLEADFKHRHSTAARFIFIDDTSIAYRPCKGQQVYSSCRDFKEPIEIECETQYLVSEIEVLIEPKHLTSQLKNCPTVSIKNEINRFCRNLKKTDKCIFSVWNFTSGYEDCYISNKTISVLFQCSDSIPVIIVSTLVILIVAAVVIIVIVCNRKKRAKKSKLCQTRQDTTAAEMIDSSDYNVINYDEMTDGSIRKINENTDQTHTTQHQPQNIKTTIEQDKNICNKYESFSPNRNSVEHFYESDSIHTHQYESLTKQQELDKHTYEFTEQTSPQHMKTSIEQNENICNRYESLSTNRNPAEHMYELDSIPISHYQSLKKQQELDEHTYESTEHAYPVSMNQELSQYESLTQPPESDKHVYASTSSPQ